MSLSLIESKDSGVSTEGNFGARGGQRRDELERTRAAGRHEADERGRQGGRNKQVSNAHEHTHHRKRHNYVFVRARKRAHTHSHTHALIASLYYISTLRILSLLTSFSDGHGGHRLCLIRR